MLPRISEQTNANIPFEMAQQFDEEKKLEQTPNLVVSSEMHEEKSKAKKM